MPALNEAQSLPLVLNALSTLKPPSGSLSCLVVDNGSTDDTAEVARDLGAQVIHENRRGYGSACLAGLAHLRDSPPDIVVFLDADYSDHPEELSLLLAPIVENRADLVMGDRTQLAMPGALMPQQRFGNALATRLIAWQTGHRYRDMGPFRAIRWNAIESLHMSDPTWGWNVEMQMRAVQQHLRVLEIPVKYRPRTGQSKISGTLKGSIRAGGKILWAVWRYR
ncbi:MAG: glycosyltransferase family 2 protein [Myxococcota bacterium]|nr:glycosyltransferase family 2 protein [Myxococcota bacterium]